MRSKADPMDTVVMLNVPLCVVGMPLYIYCTLRERLSVRDAFRSIFRSRAGSSVARSCRSLVMLVDAGVAMQSAITSHPFSTALSTYESPVSPKAKPSPGAITLPVRCPSMSPMLGRNPGSDIEYWLRYVKPMERTIISRRAADCAGRYHHSFSTGGRAVTVSLTTAESLLRTVILFGSTTLYLIGYSRPSFVRAVTVRRFDRLLCATVMALSGTSVSSFWKAFLFFGSWASASLLAPVLPLDEPADAGFFAGVLAMGFLKRSLAFFRKGKWLYSVSIFS